MRPVAPELVDISRTPAPSEAFRTPPERPKTCAACGGYHGGVNAGIACLEATLRGVRVRVRELEQGAIELQSRVNELVRKAPR